MTELFILFFGKATGAQVIFNFTMLTVGTALHMTWHVKHGIKTNEASPNSFHTGYFLRKNAMRIIAGFLIMFCTLVYMEELIHVFAKYIPNVLARVTPLIFGVLNDRFYVWGERLIEYLAKKINNIINKLSA